VAAFQKERERWLMGESLQQGTEAREEARRAQKTPLARAAQGALPQEV